MLVITRKLGEEIVIDGDIKVKVLQIKGKQVRLGVVADREISVHRKEIQDKIDAKESLEDYFKTPEELKEEYEKGMIQ